MKTWIFIIIYLLLIYYIPLLIFWAFIHKQAFRDFENLPNLHANFHLTLHAKNYATLLNTSVATKEMVHRIFKNIVPRTNLKNVGLDLLKHYTTLFALQHLLDGGIDLRFSASNNGFMNLPRHLKRLMSDWFITKETVEIKDSASEGRYESI